jgi:hypothetical protein
MLSAVWAVQRKQRSGNTAMLPTQWRTHKGPLRDILAKNTRLLRAKRGLSQEALAFECDINRTYLSAVERSERNVSIDNIAPASPRVLRSSRSGC